MYELVCHLLYVYQWEKYSLKYNTWDWMNPTFEVHAMHEKESAGLLVQMSPSTLKDLSFGW